MSSERHGTVEALDEPALLEAVRTGDQAACTALVRAHSGRLLSVARRLLRNEEDARDVLQDAFLQAFRAIGSVKGDARISTWLHRIVINTALMKLRARARLQEDSD